MTTFDETNLFINSILAGLLREHGKGKDRKQAKEFGRRSSFFSLQEGSSEDLGCSFHFITMWGRRRAFLALLKLEVQRNLLHSFLLLHHSADTGLLI